MLSITPPGPRADDWIRTSMNRFTRAEPFSVEPRRQSSTSARSRTPSASFGGWLLSQEHTRVVVVKHSRRLEPGATIVNYVASSTFQYASLMNFDQLSTRSS